MPSFVDDSSGIVPENDRIQRMKDRIAQMEKDLRSTYALAAIINKKSETAADVERYALTELYKATESLNCESFNLFTLWFIAFFLILFCFLISHSSESCGGEQTDSRSCECLGRVILSRGNFLAGALEGVGCRTVSGSGTTGPPLLRQVL